MAGDLPRTDSTAMIALAAYGEDEIIDDVERPDDNISGSEDEAPASTISDSRDDRVSSRDNTPLNTNSQTLADSRKRKAAPAPTKLVSYGADDIEEDSNEEEMESGDEGHRMDDEDSKQSSGLVNYDVSMTEPQFASSMEEPLSYSKQSEPSSKHPKVELPPEPTAKCSNKLQEKILNEYRKRGGKDLNQSIQNGKSFRNPSIYEKLITYCNIDEKGTNYPPELYNPLIWGKESCYDELAKAQKLDMDRREKEKKERTKVEFVTGTKKQTPDGTVIEQKRKSKWDSQPASSTVSKPIIITTSAINPPVISMTTSSSGVKTTVISATGTLKKSK